MNDDEKLPPHTLLIPLPTMTVEQAEKLLELFDSLSGALWSQYGEAVIDLAVVRGPSPSDVDPVYRDTDDDPPF
jgi:hypothetical protein